jgi:hypothetical protein
MPAADRPYTGGDDGPEQPFTGGLANVGKVVRAGATVRRPAGPHSPAVHALLDHLEAVGFTGAPRFLGIDDRGRSVLTFVEGTAGHAPYPAWIAGAEALVSVAELLRRFHDAVATFTPVAGAVWDRTLAPDGAAAAPILGHNDVSVENVVCRDGRAVALIDFDFTAPTDRLWDVAVALRHWVPVRDPSDLDDARADVDQVARFRAFCAVYGMAPADRGRVVELGLRFLDRAHEQMRARAEAGQPGYVEAWRNGYAAQNRRSHAWLGRHAEVLAAD